MNKQLWVVVTAAGSQAVAYSIRRGQRYVIGRAEDCDIYVPHWSVSRHHAELVYENGTLSVRDLGSMNGTAVNGKLIKAQQLTVGSTLAVGGELLKVRDQFHQGSEQENGLDTPGAFWRGGHANGLTTVREHPLVRHWVAELLSQGLSEKQVAGWLHMKPCTVHYHVEILYRDLRVHSRGEFMARMLGERAEGMRDEGSGVKC